MPEPASGVEFHGVLTYFLPITSSSDFICAEKRLLGAPPPPLRNHELVVMGRVATAQSQTGAWLEHDTSGDIQSLVTTLLQKLATTPYCGAMAFIFAD